VPQNLTKTPKRGSPKALEEIEEGSMHTQLHHHFHIAMNATTGINQPINQPTPQKHSEPPSILDGYEALQ